MPKQYDHKIDLDEVEIDLDQADVKEKPITLEIDDGELEVEDEVIEEEVPKEPEPEPEPEPAPEPPPPRYSEADDEVASLREQLAAIQRQMQDSSKRDREQSFKSQIAGIDGKLGDVRAKLRKAKDDGDIDAEMALTEELADLKLERRVVDERSRMEPEPQPQPQQPQPRQKANPLTQRWLSANSWYGSRDHAEETLLARVIDNRMAEEGWSQNQEGYFDELNRRIASKIRTVKPVSISQPKAAPPAANKPAAPQAPSQAKARPGTVRLEKSDFEVMRLLGLDPNNKDHRIQMARQKVRKNGEIG